MAASTDLIPYCLWSIPAALLLRHYLSACCAITSQGLVRHSMEQSGVGLTKVPYLKRLTVN
mgnify:CR=1 FL=1